MTNAHTRPEPDPFEIHCVLSGAGAKLPELEPPRYRWSALAPGGSEELGGQWKFHGEDLNKDELLGRMEQHVLQWWGSLGGTVDENGASFSARLPSAATKEGSGSSRLHAIVAAVRAKDRHS